MSQPVPYQVWGWGSGPEPDPRELAAARQLFEAQLGFGLRDPAPVAAMPTLPADRVSGRLPPSLAALADSTPTRRARHSLGRSYRDVVRGLAGRFDHVPDTVLQPSTDADVMAILDWCSDARVAEVPFGGGTSVVGGVEPDVGPAFTGVVSLDLRRLTGLLEVDEVSRAVHVLAGTNGPELEAALEPHGLTARFYPQSFERSTVGGWVATRAAGHFSTRLTHVDDLVESIRAATPAGWWESRRLPASGAGPSPDRMLLGSEGALGVITDVWLRVQPRPQHRWSASFAASTFTAGCAAVRALLHAGLLPATCRLIDGREAALTGTHDTGDAVLVLGFESIGGPVDAEARAAQTLLADHGLQALQTGRAGANWRESFLRAPYLRDQLVRLGALAETFETAVTWSHLVELVDALQGALGPVTCRLTHVYPDGAAPYFTVLAPARPGDELAQWTDIKTAASEVILRHHATITHHHAVGRDHRTWYERQRPGPFAIALRAAKQAVDPAGVCNPQVLGLQ